MPIFALNKYFCIYVPGNMIENSESQTIVGLARSFHCGPGAGSVTRINTFRREGMEGVKARIMIISLCLLYVCSLGVKQSVWLLTKLYGYQGYSEVNFKT